jgi:acyl carrier protein
VPPQLAANDQGGERMTKQEALRWLERTLDLPAHALTGAERLRDVEAWDSLSTLAVIAMVDKEFGVPIPAREVVGCQTVAELIHLLTAAATNRAA